MLTQFRERFPVDDEEAVEFEADPSGPAADVTVSKVLEAFGGRSFGRGLYRFHEPLMAPTWTSLASAAFPALPRSATTFAADWLGRQYAIIEDSGDGTVLQLDLHWAELFDTGHPLGDFHDKALVGETDRYLLTELNTHWRRAGGATPSQTQCVEFVIPLFLGGREDVSNMAMTDMEVLWEVTAQLLEQTRDLPPGSIIGDVHLTGDDA